VRGNLLERLFSRDSPLLPLILKAQLAFLAVLAAMAFLLPLSCSETWVVVLAGRRRAGRAYLGDPGSCKAEVSTVAAARPKSCSRG
jgi:hypothetical protein